MSRPGGLVAVTAVFALSFSAAGEVHVYLDQSSYEAALVSSTVVDFEGVPDGQIIVRPAGYSWGGLVAGVTMWQMDKDVPGYYGAPYLSDFIASTLYSQPVLFELPSGTNAIGGQWFHGQILEYDGQFKLTLADNSTFEYVYEDIATGREESVPDFCGFICAEQDIVSIDFHVERLGNPAVSLADNINFGHGTPGAVAFKNWNPAAPGYPGNLPPNAILADDVQVAPGNEGKQITALTVDVMTWNYDGAGFFLYIYDDNPATGLPGALLGLGYLTYLEYGERATASVEIPNVFIPADGFMWVGVEATTSGSGWFIADQYPQIGASDDLVAIDEGDGFHYADLGATFISNMQLVVGVPLSECPEDVNGDGVVDIDDVFAILGAWGPCDDCPEDVNDDGTVDIDDLFEVLGAWGPCP
ncbi:MAG: hypothetical protein JSV91_08445 [Phycisphaerales bacterium]|nr:MAG: hypothetical protein JSV91_08445 [Phycisphaerales bacterium]